MTDQQDTEQSGKGVHDLVYHDDQTMAKVYDGLRDAGLTIQQALSAVNSMQNKGVLFRECPR